MSDLIEAITTAADRLCDPAQLTMPERATMYSVVHERTIALPRTWLSDGTGKKIQEHIAAEALRVPEARRRIFANITAYPRRFYARIDEEAGAV